MLLTSRQERIFMSHVVVRDDGCWEWTAKVNLGYGYTTFTHDGKERSMVAHRAAYLHFVGPIPDGLKLDHLCHTRAIISGECEPGVCRHRRCVNPAHLEPVTPRENTMRSPTITAINAAKTHCKYGHEYNAENTRIDTKGGRACRPCDRARDAEWRARTGRGKRSKLPPSEAA